MFPRDFEAWCQAMFERHGWRDVQIAEQLGCGRNQPSIWREKGAPAYIGLACAALANGLPTWRAA